MNVNFFPHNTLVQHHVSKSTFFTNLKMPQSIRDLITQDIEEIEWYAKFAPSTLNIADGINVHEITVFKVSLRQLKSPTAAFDFIDATMPRYCVFMQCFDDKMCFYINFKEPIVDNGTGRVYHLLSGYSSAWQSEKDIDFLLHGTDMDQLYADLVKQIAAEKIIVKDSDLKSAILKTKEYQALILSKDKLERKRRIEKQPHKLFDLHHQIRDLERKAHAVLNSGSHH